MTGFEDLDDDAGDRDDRDSGFNDLDAALDREARQSDDDAGAEPREETSPDPKTTPAFEYDDTKNAAQYVRPETAERVDDAWEFDVKRYLVREIGLENVAKREWQDAILRYAAENPKRVADLVVEAREDRHGPLDEPDA